MSKNGGNREAMGRQRDEASFPVPPISAAVPSDYLAVLSEIKERIQQTRLRTVLAANAAMTLMYWDIGQVILKRQADQGWGAKVIDRLSADLRQAFPEMRGLSPRNLTYMRAFAAAWSDRAIVQRVIAQIPWRQNIALLEQLLPGRPSWSKPCPRNSKVACHPSRRSRRSWKGTWNHDT